MRVRNISKIVLYYVKIHRKHIGKTIVVHNLKTDGLHCLTPTLRIRARQGGSLQHFDDGLWLRTYTIKWISFHARMMPFTHRKRHVLRRANRDAPPGVHRAVYKHRF